MYSLKYRIYPNYEQSERIDQHIGSVRFIYNHFLSIKKESYDTSKKTITYKDTSKLLTDLKQIPDYKWLNDTYSHSLQTSLRHLDTAYNKFFSKKGGYPNFKKKGRKESFYYKKDSVRFILDEKLSNKSKHVKYLYKLKLPKIDGLIDIRIDRLPYNLNINDYNSITLSKDSSGYYYVSVLYNDSLPTRQRYLSNNIGIDLGLTDLLVCNNGYKVKNPKKYLDLKGKIDVLKQDISKKYRSNKGKDFSNSKTKYNKRSKQSNVIIKQQLRINKLERKSINQRNDLYYKISHKLCSENQMIGLETLKIKKMLQNKQYSSNIHSTAWGRFVSILINVAKKYGTDIVQIDPYAPTTKKCNCCGFVNHNLTIEVRHWTCPSCNVEHDRDINAAINILNIALENYIIRVGNSTILNHNLQLIEDYDLEDNHYTDFNLV